MSCDCTTVNKIPSCIDTLIIGDVANPNANYYVYLKTPDGRIDRYSAIDVVYTDQIGIESPQVRIGTVYEIWVTLASDEQLNERVAFTPFGATSTVTCVNVEFSYCDSEFNYQYISV